MQTMQSDMETVAVGADVGFLGGAAGSGIDNMVAPAGTKVIAQAGTQAFLASGGEATVETVTQLDWAINTHSRPQYHFGMIVGVGLVAGLAAGADQMYGNAIPKPTNRQLGNVLASQVRLERTNAIGL